MDDFTYQELLDYFIRPALTFLYNMAWRLTMPLHSPRLFWICLTGCSHLHCRLKFKIQGFNVYECGRCRKQFSVPWRKNINKIKAVPEGD